MPEAAQSLTGRPKRPRQILQVGDKVFRWTVIAEAPKVTNSKGHQERRLLCRCDCGTLTVKRPANLRYGSSMSCGCLHRERLSIRQTTHGATRGAKVLPEYLAWQHMLGRCYRPAVDAYPWYGGRGITVCQRWVDDFHNFFADMGSKPSPAHSIDRIDVNGNYEPSNCRWADKKQQARNTRRNRHYLVRGERRILAEIAETVGMSETSIRNRIERGWSLDEIDRPPLSSVEAARRASIARWQK